jgi:hypothetical protein
MWRKVINIKQIKIKNCRDVLENLEIPDIMQLWERYFTKKTSSWTTFSKDRNDRVKAQCVLDYYKNEPNPERNPVQLYIYEANNGTR